MSLFCGFGLLCVSARCESTQRSDEGDARIEKDRSGPRVWEKRTALVGVDGIAFFVRLSSFLMPVANSVFLFLLLLLLFGRSCVCLRTLFVVFKMPRYNILAIARHTVPKETLRDVIKQCSGFVVDSGGMVESIENFGQKQLPYRIGQVAGTGPRVSVNQCFPAKFHCVVAFFIFLSRERRLCASILLAVL